MKTASMFIVPNAIGELRRDFFATAGIIRQAATFGIADNPGPWVQVWIHDGENENLTDHGLDKSWKAAIGIDQNERCYAPSFVPLSLLEGKKEGDSLDLIAPNGAEIKIKLEQLPYRYGRFGSFQEVLTKLKTQYERNNNAL